jgi:microcompartment protein CcmL/EutN
VCSSDLLAAHIIARVHGEVEGILPTEPSAAGGGRDGEVCVFA